MKSLSAAIALPHLISRLPSFSIKLADVGSIGGLKGRWKPAASVVSALLFDPREGGPEEPRASGANTIYPFALGSAEGQARLNVTFHGNMSSTMKPNQNVMAPFRGKTRDIRIVDHIDMPVKRLDDITDELDVIKVDTQGSELDILNGAGLALEKSVMVVEIEVSFIERYEGQPTCDVVVQYMRQRGFHLIDLYQLRRYVYANSVDTSGGGDGDTRAGHLSYGDAIFARSLEGMQQIIAASDEDAERKLLATVVALLVYGKADLASAIYDKCRECLSPPAEFGLSLHLKHVAKEMKAMQAERKASQKTETKPKLKKEKSSLLSLARKLSPWPA